jgi:hypothetical protein
MQRSPISIQLQMAQGKQKVYWTEVLKAKCEPQAPPLTVVKVAPQGYGTRVA